MLKTIFLTSLEVDTTLVSITKVFYTAMLSFLWLAGSSQKHSATHWCLQNIAQESIDSSDEEFFDARGWCCSCFPTILIPLSPFPLEIIWSTILTFKTNPTSPSMLSCLFLNASLRKNGQASMSTWLVVLRWLKMPDRFRSGALKISLHD